MDSQGHIGLELEAEEPQDPAPTDIAHWLDIYTDLIAFTQAILEQTVAEMERSPGPARRHLENTNVRVLREELVAFERRRLIWEQRSADSRDALKTSTRS